MTALVERWSVTLERLWHLAAQWVHHILFMYCLPSYDGAVLQIHDSEWKMYNAIPAALSCTFTEGSQGCHQIEELISDLTETKPL